MVGIRDRSLQGPDDGEKETKGNHFPRRRWLLPSPDATLCLATLLSCFCSTADVTCPAGIGDVDDAILEVV